MQIDTGKSTKTYIEAIEKTSTKYFNYGRCNFNDSFHRK